MTKGLTVSDYIYVTLEVVVGLLAVLTNSILLIALWRYRRLRTFTTYFVSSLGCAGLCMGIVTPTVAAILLTGLSSTFYLCVLVVCLVNTLPALTTLSLLCVVIDRYCHVLYPEAYLRWATKLNVTGMLSASWLLGMLVGFVPFVWHKDPEGFHTCSCSRVLYDSYTVYVFFLGFFVPILLILAVLITQAFRAFHVSNSRHRGRTTRLASVIVESEHMLHKKEIFLFKRLMVVFMLLVLSSLPLYLMVAMTLWIPSLVAQPDVRMFLLALSHISSFTNPLVYTYKRSEFHLIVASVWPLYHRESDNSPGQCVLVHPPQAKCPVSGHYSFLAMSGNTGSTSSKKMQADTAQNQRYSSELLASVQEETGCSPASSHSAAKDRTTKKGDT